MLTLTPNAGDLDLLGEWGQLQGRQLRIENIIELIKA